MSPLVDSATEPLLVRRVRFDWSDVDVSRWHPRLPEFAAGANAISLLMPHAEPYVIAAVRRVEAGDSPDARDWARQEAAHFKAHRAFNAQLTAVSRTARALDRMGAWLFARLARRSATFGIAFAAAFELVAFASARWAEAGLRTYFGGADDRAATLFLWHLAEEVEHKGVVHDVFDKTEGARRRYPAAVLAAFVTLIGFTIVGGLALFCSTRHALNPFRWFRLVTWGVSLAFVLLPVLVMSLAAGFHTDALVDPPWMAGWLREYDAASATMPVWTDAGRNPRSDASPVPHAA